MFHCILCGTKTIWQCDYSADEVGYDFEGIVGVYMCSHCNTMYEVVDNLDMEERFFKYFEIEDEEDENSENK